MAATLAIWRCPKPVIAQVHGYALAGGLELAMACDLVVAAEDAQLGEPEIRFGSAPVTLLMPYLVGQKKTRELLLTGDLVDGTEAARIGLVNRVVPAERLADEVDALADKLARVEPDVMAPTKLMLNRAMEAAGFLAAVEMGLDVQSMINMSETSRAVRRDRPRARPQGRAGLARRALRGAAGGAGPAPSGDGPGEGDPRPADLPRGSPEGRRGRIARMSRSAQPRPPSSVVTGRTAQPARTAPGHVRPHPATRAA